MNPDTKSRAMGAVTYEVELVDLSAHGMPGFCWSGFLHVVPDKVDWVEDWWIEEVAPANGTITTKQADCIKAAVLADTNLCDFISGACFAAGEE
jgi:hypothetical protein